MQKATLSAIRVHIVTSPVLIVGAKTISMEVLPDQAAVMLSGPRSTDWDEDYPTPGTALSVERLLKTVAAGEWEPGFGMYTVQPIDGLVCGGWAFYSKPDRDGRVEIGYGLAPSGRGRGLMSDAVQSAVAWARRQPAVRRVWAGVDHDNVDSIRLLEATGFERRQDHDGARRYEIAVAEDTAA